MSEAFAELKEEINRFQRGLQAAAEHEPQITAGTPLHQVPRALSELLRRQRVLVLRYFNNGGPPAEPWRKEFLQVFDFEQDNPHTPLRFVAGLHYKEEETMGNTTDVDKKPPSPEAKAQIHSKFKVFIPEANIPYEDAMRQLNGMVVAFTKDSKIAPKSVGIEYLEARKALVLSLGYRDDEPGYPVNIISLSLGKPDLTPTAIEAKMTEVASNVPNFICHEFFVTGDNEFVMVLLTHG